MFNISFSSRKPLYEQLYSQVVQQIALGVLKPNEQLPPVRTLAAHLGINPNTVSKAYTMLERDGYTYNAVGRGSFISENTGYVELQKKKALEEFDKAVEKTISSGVSKQEMLGVFQKHFKEGELND